MGVAIMQWLSDATNVMLVCGGFALLVSGLMLVSPGRARQAGEWILIGTAALAVVLASDLVDKLDNGTVGVKLVMIALVASALKLSDTFAAWWSTLVSLILRVAYPERAQPCNQ